MSGQNDLFAALPSNEPPKQPSGALTSLELRELGEAVARRARNLVVPEPILDLERTKSQRDTDFSRHDFRLLCLIVLDTVIDRMGFGAGATRRDLLNALAPVLRDAEPGVTPARERLILDMLLDALLNEKGRRQRFFVRYATLDNNRVRWVEFEYALLEERQVDEGEDRVLRASKEAINLYTSMLGLDLEDAAVADAAVLRYQAERGRLDDAIQTAHQAQIRAKAYAEHVRLRLEIARRDVDQAAWNSQVVPVIEDALAHIRQRIDTERELRRGLEQRRDQASGEDEPKLSLLLKEIEKSEATNLDLHRLLLTANQQFLEEHARQRLRRPSAALLPNLEPDVLAPWVALACSEALARFDPVLAGIAGVRPPRLASLDTLWNRLLAPPIVATPAEAVTGLPSTSAVADVPPPFGRDDFDATARFLRKSLAGSQRLSQVLAAAQEVQLERAALRLLVLLTMQQFGAGDDRRQFHVSPAGEPLSIAGFAGDDLLLSRL